MKNGNIAIFAILGMKNSELIHICEYVISHTIPNSDIYHILKSKYVVKKIKVWLFLTITINQLTNIKSFRILQYNIHVQYPKFIADFPFLLQTFPKALFFMFYYMYFSGLHVWLWCIKPISALFQLYRGGYIFRNSNDCLWPCYFV